MILKRRKKTGKKLESPVGMLCLLAGGFALFSVLFRYEVSPVSTTEHRTGQITLLPVAENSEIMTWLEIHDPARIARGGGLPEPEPRPEPGNAPKPAPEVAMPAPAAVAPVPVARAVIPPALPPVCRPAAAGLKFAALAPEIYPRALINGTKYGRRLPEPLLKQAAAVNAGTVELRFSQGILPGDIRTSVVRSSGSIRLDQALMNYFTKHKFREFPAYVRIVWHAAGEVEK